MLRTPLPHQRSASNVASIGDSAPLLVGYVRIVDPARSGIGMRGANPERRCVSPWDITLEAVEANIPSCTRQVAVLDAEIIIGGGGWQKVG